MALTTTMPPGRKRLTHCAQGHVRTADTVYAKDGGCRVCADRRSTLKVRRRLYGIDEAGYAALAANQGGVCAVCGHPPDGSLKERTLHVDHDHATGRIRGLLCRGCNQAIGNARDDPATLRAAAAYVERNRAPR